MGLYISITPEAGGGELVLCDSPDPIPVFNFRINNQRVLQVSKSYLADHQRVRGRGNKLNRITFEVPARDVDDDGAGFGNMAEGLGWAIDHVDAVPDAGLLTVVISDGGAEVTRYFDNAGVESAELTNFRGARMSMAYVIMAGEKSSEAP